MRATHSHLAEAGWGPVRHSGLRGLLGLLLLPEPTASSTATTAATSAAVSASSSTAVTASARAAILLRSGMPDCLHHERPCHFTLIGGARGIKQPEDYSQCSYLCYAHEVMVLKLRPLCHRCRKGQQVQTHGAQQVVVLGGGGRVQGMH